MPETSEKAPVFLSIVVPAFNEAQRLPYCISSLKEFLKNIDKRFEILFVIEKSEDNSLAIAQDSIANHPGFRVIANSVQKGKGYAVRKGMLETQGEIAIFMDTDLSTPLKEIPRFLEYLNSHPEIDILIGDRAQQKSQITKRQGRIRQEMGKTFNRIVQGLAIKGFADTQCGFKAFRKKTISTLFGAQKTNGFAFDVELLLLAQKLGFRFEALPVEWHNSEESKVDIFWDPLKMMRDLVRIRWRHRNTKPIVGEADEK